MSIDINRRLRRALSEIGFDAYELPDALKVLLPAFKSVILGNIGEDDEMFDFTKAAARHAKSKGWTQNENLSFLIKNPGALLDFCKPNLKNSFAATADAKAALKTPEVPRAQIEARIAWSKALWQHVDRDNLGGRIRVFSGPRLYFLLGEDIRQNGKLPTARQSARICNRFGTAVPEDIETALDLNLVSDMALVIRPDQIRAACMESFMMGTQLSILGRSSMARPILRPVPYISELIPEF